MTDALLFSSYEIFTSSAASVLSTVNDSWQSSVLWMLIVGFIIAFILAFAVGANDVANSFGTTVGAGTLTLKQACILASVFETIGAILLGAKVGTTIRKGIIDVSIYDGKATILMAGEISAMLASGLWQLIATFLKLPVSGTHSIVGATVGFSLVAQGTTGVNWKKIGLIVGSWFLSPILAGIMAAGFYFILRLLIFQKDDPVRPGLVALPIMYSVTVTINWFSVLFAGSPLLGFDKLPLWGCILIALGIGILVAILVQLVVVRRLRKSFKAMADKKEPSQPPIAFNNFGGKKISKLPPLMETISERDSPEESPSKGEKDETEPADQPKRNRFRSLQWSLNTPSTREEAKLLRQRTSKRSRSTGQVLSNSSVRIPPVLQLEKKVLKANLPPPSVREVKEEIRRNFSEPVMMSLTKDLEADKYEVYINRPRKLVTIHRRNNSTSDVARRQPIDNKDSDAELECLLTTISGDIKLDEPFDDSDDEGLVMAASKINDTSVSTFYSGAIEEGFRRLSTSQQNIIAIKISEDDSEVEIDTKKEDVLEAREGRPEVRKMFSFLQILTACFGAFAHGGNDVSNAIGPLIAIWIIYNEGGVEQKASTPILILVYGGVGICAGLWVWGRRVIETMGKDLTNLTPSRGFTIELMSAITVLMASNLGLPVSTTHCKVGAVVAVGWVRAREAVDWKIFRNIVLAWFVTVPISGGLSAIIFIAVKALAGLS